MELPRLGADDAFGHGALESQRAADGKHTFADGQGIGVTKENPGAPQWTDDQWEAEAQKQGFPNGQMGSSRDMIEAVSNGTQQLITEGAANFLGLNKH